jgi:hypothetical protein
MFKKANFFIRPTQARQDAPLRWQGRQHPEKAS